MLRWWEVESEWVMRKGSPLESELNPYPPLVRALLLLWAVAYILPHRPGRPDTAPSCWLAPTPVCKPAALGGLLCLLPHSRVPRVSCSDSNQHCHTTELFILCSSQCKKKQPVLPVPGSHSAISLGVWASLICHQWIHFWELALLLLTPCPSPSHFSEAVHLEGHNPALR